MFQISITLNNQTVELSSVLHLNVVKTKIDFIWGIICDAYRKQSTVATLCEFSKFSLQNAV